MNLATGNLQIQHAVCAWGGRGGGLSFMLFYNSQSTRTFALGPKWNHSFGWRILGTNPAVVIAGDGTETSYSLVSGQYVSPAGITDSLVRNGDNTWTLTTREGIQYRFRSDGLLSSIVDLNGNTITCGWAGSNLTQVTDAAGRRLLLGYTNGKITSVTDAEGRVWGLQYDGPGRLLRVNDPQINGQTYYTQFGYGTSNNLTSVHNRLNKVWSFAYGSSSILSSMTDPDQKSWSIGYSSPGGGGGVEGFSIPPGGWPTSVTVVATGTDPTGRQEQFGLDSSGRPAATRDGSGSQTERTFDSQHRMLTLKLPSGGQYTYGYDAQGNRTSEQDPAGKVTQMTYGQYGRMTSVTDPNNLVTQYGYDAFWNQTSVTDPTGAVVQTTYNADGSPSSVIDAGGKITEFLYDAWGNRTSVRDPNNHVTQFVYNTPGKTLLTSRTDARSRVTNYTHDAWGRLTGIAYPGGGPGVSLVYDAEGRLTQSIDGTGARTYSYDSWGRKTAQTDPRGNTVATYDGAGRLLTQTDPSARQVQYGYDPAGRLSLVGDPAGNAQYAYTVDGRIAAVLYPNGVEGIWSYDAAGRVSSLVWRNAATWQTVVAYAAVYDNAGRLTQITEQPSGDVTTFSYDNAGRLTAENRTGQRAYSSAYSYDSRGNRLTAVRSEGGIVSHDGAYTYDDASRLIQVVDSATNQTEVYTWFDDNTLASYPGPGYTRLLDYDEEGRLTRIRKDFGGGNIQPAYEYGYGFDGGRRWRKDYSQNPWTWYPCGVACCAGDLVEMESDLNGINWTTTAQKLKGQSLIRRNSEFHHLSINQSAEVITSGTPALISHNLYDQFGLRRYAQGAAATPFRSGIECGCTDEDTTDPSAIFAKEGLYLAGRGLAYHAEQATMSACDRNKQSPSPVNCQDCCDEYLIGWLKKKIKKGCKEIIDCIRNCEQQYPYNSSARSHCIRGCIGPGAGLSQPVKQFIECCYTACLPDGRFNPPGRCKLK